MATEGIVTPLPPALRGGTSYNDPERQQPIPEGATVNVHRTTTNRSLAGPTRTFTNGSRMSRHGTRESQKPRVMDPNLDINLPYRIMTQDANLAEYTREQPNGTMETGVTADGTPYNVVAFEPNDPDNPKNWSKLKKWWITMVVAVTCLVVALCSSVITAGVDQVAREFEISREVALLSITVFVIGFGVGPMVFAPLSEIYGRQVVYIGTLSVAVIFIIPCAVAKNTATLMVCRAIDGIAFSAPMTLVGGTLADCWKTEERGVPMAAFSAAPFIGPALGPLIGGYLSDGKGWRWLYWIQLILAGFIWIVITFTVPETYAPTILARRAKRLNKNAAKSGEKKVRYVTEQDLDLLPFATRMKNFLLRPFQLLFTELIVFLISIYMSVLYGLLYMFFVAYPIVYKEGKGWSAGKTGLMFLPLAAGVIVAALCAPLVNRHYLKMAMKHGGNPPPEVRLYPMMLSCWLIPIGLFIFAWTSYPRLSWAGPAFSGLPVGFGFIFLYNSANNYMVDSYQHQAASALAAKTCIRSFWGASTVLFTSQMYARLGYQWASSLLAFLALACCGIPYLFFYYGAKIRSRSKYAYSGTPVAGFDAGH